MSLDLLEFYNLPIEQYVNRKVYQVTDRDSVQTAVELLTQKNIGCLIVSYEDGKIGILSERDILREYAMELYDFYEIPVGNIMTVHPVMIDIKEPLGLAFKLMDKHHFRHLPVSENGKVIGVISLRDLARAFMANLPKNNPR